MDELSRPVKSPDPVFFKDIGEWRQWLKRNHDKETEVWMLTYKVHTNRKSLRYFEALDEALCWGWIDSRVRRIDDEKHLMRFAPRRPSSIWSLGNRRRVERLIKEGRMTAHGLAKVKAAKRTGEWDNAIAPSTPPRMPSDLRDALTKDAAAWKNFKAFARSYRTAYIYWVRAAKREETRRKRIAIVVEKSRENKRSWMF